MKNFPLVRIVATLLISQALILASVFSASSHAALSPGQSAPEFALKNQDGKTIKLSDFKGKPVLLYFYPKDDTPGCTREACSFRDQFSKFKALGAVVLGVSTQDEKSHLEFKTKHKLPFDLLIDEDGGLAKVYGIEMHPGGKMYRRQSVLIGADHKILKVYKDVDPDRHAAEVLKDVQK